jgi:hypothetical protein
MSTEGHPDSFFQVIKKNEIVLILRFDAFNAYSTFCNVASCHHNINEYILAKKLFRNLSSAADIFIAEIKKASVPRRTKVILLNVYHDNPIYLINT